MNWSWFIGLAAIFASLYWLVLVGYRLFLSLKGLQAAAVPLNSNLALLAEPIERDAKTAETLTAFAPFGRAILKV